MYRVFRWFVFVPAAFVASIIAGAVANYVYSIMGGSSWYGWVLSGGASAWAFFFTAFRVAPSVTPAVKWVLVGLVGLLGALAALGPLLTGHEPVRSLGGLVMVGFAIHFARLSIGQLPGVTGATVE